MANYKKVRKLKSVEAAYLAGLIDGEGTITLTRKASNEQRSLVVSIANTEKILLEYPQEIIGAGKVTPKHTTKVIHTPSFSYKISGRQALDLLKQIAPFLQSYKKARAKLVLKDYIRYTPRNGKYNPVLLEGRGRFVATFFNLRNNKHSPEKLYL